MIVNSTFIRWWRRAARAAVRPGAFVRATTAVVVTPVAALIALTACSSDSNDSASTTAAGQPVRVVASTNVYGDIARQIGGDDVQVTSMINDPNARPALLPGQPRRTNCAVQGPPDHREWRRIRRFRGRACGHRLPDSTRPCSTPCRSPVESCGPGPQRARLVRLPDRCASYPRSSRRTRPGRSRRRRDLPHQRRHVRRQASRRCSKPEAAIRAEFARHRSGHHRAGAALPARRRVAL